MRTAQYFARSPQGVIYHAYGSMFSLPGMLQVYHYHNLCSRNSHFTARLLCSAYYLRDNTITLSLSKLDYGSRVLTLLPASITSSPVLLVKKSRSISSNVSPSPKPVPASLSNRGSISLTNAASHPLSTRSDGSHASHLVLVTPLSFLYRV